jgi:hypothetical protein
MTTHLTDDEFAAAVAGLEIASQATEHLSSCVSCRQGAAELQRFVAERLDGIAAGAPDWQEQRHAVMARLVDKPAARYAPARRWLRPFLAAAAVLVVAVGVGLLMPPGAAAPPATDDLAVEQILAEVVNSSQFDPEAVRATYAAFQTARQKLENERFEMLLEVRQVLTTEQWQKLRELKRRAQQMRQQRHPGERPQGDRPPGGGI